MAITFNPRASAQELWFRVEPIAATGVAALSAVSRFTQQKPRNEVVQGLKVATLIGSSIATTPWIVTLGPASLLVRPLVHTVAVRVVVISANILSIGVESYWKNRSFKVLLGELSNKQEENPFTVEVLSQAVAEGVWLLAKPHFVPASAGRLMASYIKGAVKLPVGVITSHVGNAFYNLRPSDLVDPSFLWEFNPWAVFEKESVKCGSESISNYWTDFFDCKDQPQAILLQMGSGVLLGTIVKVAKNCLCSVLLEE